MDFCIPDNETVKQDTIDSLFHLTFVDLEVFEKAFLSSYEYNDTFVRRNLMKGFTLCPDTRKAILPDAEETTKSR